MAYRHLADDKEASEATDFERQMAKRHFNFSIMKRAVIGLLFHGEINYDALVMSASRHRVLPPVAINALKSFLFHKPSSSDINTVGSRSTAVD